MLLLDHLGIACVTQVGGDCMHNAIMDIRVCKVYFGVLQNACWWYMYV